MKQASSQALTARAIKKELKAKFPKSKISVRSESFSMGDAVNVEYIGHASYETIDALLKKYQYGKFDSMNDIYNMDNQIDHLPQVKYVCLQVTKPEEVTNF